MQRNILHKRRIAKTLKVQEKGSVFIGGTESNNLHLWAALANQTGKHIISMY